MKNSCMQKPDLICMIQSVVLLGCIILILSPKAFADTEAHADSTNAYKIATTYYSAYGQSRTLYINVKPGSHKFEVDGIAQYMNTEWYLTYSGGSPVKTQNSGFWAIDPDYTHNFAEGTTWIRAEVYDKDWKWKEAHRWEVTVAETVTTPNTPSGLSSGETGQSLSFSTGGSTSNLGHSVQYRFDWGDGNVSSWGNVSQSKTYNSPGTFQVKAQSRCSSHTSVTSSWSGSKSVTISRSKSGTIVKVDPDSFSGVAKTITVTVKNNGRDDENLIVKHTAPSGWSISPSTKETQVPYNTTNSSYFTFTVIPLSGSNSNATIQWRLYYDDPWPTQDTILHTYNQSVSNTVSGNIQATLNDQDGNPSLASRTKFIRYPGAVTITGSNPGTFTNVTPDGYWVEGYQKGSFNEYEFWGSEYADVKANQTIPVLINRHTPYCEDFWFEYKGGRVNPDDSIPPGVTITSKALIRNKDTSSRSVYVNIGWRYGTSGSAVGTKQSSTVTVGANSTVTISLSTVTLTANTQGNIYAYIKTYGKFTDWTLTDSWDWTKAFSVKENPIIKFIPPYDNATISNQFDIISDVGFVIQNSTSFNSEPLKGKIHQTSMLNINYFGVGTNTVYDTIKWKFIVDESGKYKVRVKVNYDGQIFSGGIHGIYDCKHSIILAAKIINEGGDSIFPHNTMDEDITSGMIWLSTTAVKAIITALNTTHPGGWASNLMTAVQIIEFYEKIKKIEEFAIPTLIKGEKYLSFDAELLANNEYEFHFIMFNVTNGGVSAAKLVSLTNIVSSFDEVTFELISDPEKNPVIAVEPEVIVSIGTTYIKQAKTKNNAFTVKNIGDSQLIGEALIESGPFSIVSGGSYNLSPGGESNISIRFYSSSPGIYTNKISFSGGGDAERYVRCQTIDTIPSLIVYPEEEIDFGGVKVGYQKDIESFVVSNDGGGTLIGEVTVENPFEVISGKEYSLTSGEAQIAIIRFKPTSTESFNKEVSFTGGNGSTRYVKGIGVDPTLVADDAPATFIMFQNYPNPFNPTTTISFSLPEACHVILKVYNIEGKEVVTLVDNSYSNGIHSIEWDASDFSSGIYFYILQAGTFEETKKLLFMK